MKIPFNNFAREYASLKSEIEGALQRVMEPGPFILGPEVQQFEKDFAAYNGVRYGVAVNSGTDALYLSLLAAGIGPGDEVIVPVNTALPTAMAVAMSGARPIFVDCNESFLIDIRAAAAAITERTKAIIPVHLYGQACDLDRLRELADSHGFILIEDCAQAAGAHWRGKKVGSVGDLSAYSFYPTKTLGAYGDGGMILTNSEEHSKKLQALRFYGEADRVHSKMFGVNSRLDEMQAAILNVKLKHLDRMNERRREIAKRYGELLAGAACTLPFISDTSEHVYHLFVIRSEDRDGLRARLLERGIETLIHYPVLLHRQPFFRTDATFPNAETYATQILSLPLHPYLTDTEVGYVAEAVRPA